MSKTTRYHAPQCTLDTAHTWQACGYHCGTRGELSVCPWRSQLRGTPPLFMLHDITEASRAVVGRRMLAMASPRIRALLLHISED